MPKSTTSVLSIMVFFCLSFQATAQSAIDKVSAETCTCLEKRLPSGKMESGQLEMVLGLCMLEAGNKHSDVLEKELGLKMNSVENMEKLGEIIGEHLAENCDKFMEVIFTMMGEEDNEIMKQLMAEMEAENTGITGKVVEVEGDEFLSIKIKSGGKVMTFHVIGELEGKPVVDKGRSLLGETVSVQYTESKVYSPKSKTFVTVNELTKIEIE